MSHLHIRFATLLAFLLFLTKNTITAQLSVLTDRANHFYQAGETVRFRIQSATGGAVSYKIGYDLNTPVLQNGTVSTQAGVPSEVSFTLSQPGAVFCWAEQNGWRHSAQAVFSPYQIQPAETEPADFDAFWATQVAAARALPFNPQLTFYSYGARSMTYLLQLDHLDGRKIYGYLTIPNGATNVPALVHFPPLGSNPGLVHPMDYLSDEMGCLSLALSIHNAPPNQTDPNAYLPNDATNRNTIYYRYAILAGIRAIDYLFSRNDFDKQNLVLTGESQGGGLSMMVAGLDPRVDVVVGSISALSEHGAWKYGRASSFPYYTHYANLGSYGNQAIINATQEATKYYDAQFFARRFSGETFTSIGYRDEVCPPATIFSMLNQTRGRQLILHAMQIEHNHADEYWLTRNEVIRRILVPTRTPVNNPFPPTSTGLWVDAGADFNANTGSAVQLNGRVQINLTDNATLPVRWEMVSGPAAVQFSNQNARNSSATFSAAGTYILKFSTTDEALLSSKQRYFTAADFVQVTVTDDNPPPPACSLSATFSQTTCVDNATPFDASDDSWRTTLLVQGANAGNQGWRATFSGQTITGSYGVSRTVTGLTLGQNVVFQISDVQNSTCATTLTVASPQPCVQTPPPTVCQPKGLEPWWQWIKNVKFAGIDHTSSKEQYADFTTKIATVERGKTYPITLTPDFSWLSYTESWRVWIDWNNDGDFLDSGEMVFQMQSTSAVSGQIVVPTTAILGKVKMRVAMKNGGYPTPCEEFQFGEVEDYTVDIKSASTPQCNLTATSSQTTCLDNGTPNLASDDTWRTNILVIGSNTGSQGWRATFSGQTITGSYGVSRTVTGLTLGQNVVFQISDVQNTTCTTSLTVSSPQPCVQTPPCSISAAASQQTCRDNGTPYVGSDDFWECQLLVNASNGGSNGWRATFSGRTITGQYGVPVQISQLAFGSNLSITITDVTKTTCSQTISVVPPPTCVQTPPVTTNYCTASANQPWHEWISRVYFNNVNYKTSGKSNYSDYTSIEIPLRGGRTHSTRLDATFSFQTQACTWQVWIDLNQNNIFEAPSELVIFTAAPVPTPRNNAIATTFANFFLPASAKNGKTRMRIIFSPQSTANACGNYDIGEVEDYTVVISEGTSNLLGGDSREVEIEKSSSEKLSVFPVPASQFLNIEASEFLDKALEIKLIDVFGRIVFSEKLDKNTSEIITLDLSQIHNGFYQLNFEFADRRPLTRKIVVEHGR